MQPIFAEAKADFYRAMEHIEKQSEGAFIVRHSEGDTTYTCRLIGGFSLFGVMVAKSGNYDKYFPPVSNDDIFIEITSNKNNVPLEKYRDLFRSYTFELSASLSFDLAKGTRPNIEEYGGDNEKAQYNEKFRPLIVGKGLSEPLELYIKAIESPTSDIAILYFTKIIEFVSQTVIRIQLTERVRSKLLSQRALDPDAEFIKELGQIYEENKVYKKDRDAIRLTIESCCDASELQRVIPNCIAANWNKHISNNNVGKALQELAFCIASTRNSIAHAKANYETTGGEAPEADFIQLGLCMRVCTQQVIRWYSGRHESQRLW